MTKLDEVKKMSISDMLIEDWDRRRFAKEVLVHDNSGVEDDIFDGIDTGEHHEYLDRKAKEITVGELLEAFEHRSGCSFVRCEKNFFRKLLSHGLTKFDHPLIPENAEYRRLFCSISLDGWRGYSILLLREFPAMILEDFEKAFGKNPVNITIGDLLSPEDYQRHISGQTMGNIKRSLADLGFGHGDPDFVFNGSGAEFLESLMDEYELPKGVALKFLSIATAKGWYKPGY